MALFVVAMAAGFLLLGVSPLIIIAVLVAQLGLAAAACYFVIEALVAAARALLPVQTPAWCEAGLAAAREHDDAAAGARVARTALLLELGAAAIAAAGVAAIAPLVVGDLLGGAAPWWLLPVAMFRPVCRRISSLAGAIGKVVPDLRRQIETIQQTYPDDRPRQQLLIATLHRTAVPRSSALVASLLPALPLLALVAVPLRWPSLVTIVVVVSVLDLVVTAVVLRDAWRRYARSGWSHSAAAGAQPMPRATSLRGVVPPWGEWMVGVARAAPVVVLAVVAGSAAVPGYEAATTMQVLLTLSTWPVAAFAASRGRRLVRAGACAVVAVAAMLTVGPWLYLRIFPAALADGVALLRILAWQGVWIALVAIRIGPGRRVPQWLQALGAVISAVLVTTLVLAFDARGAAAAAAAFPLWFVMGAAERRSPGVTRAP